MRVPGREKRFLVGLGYGGWDGHRAGVRHGAVMTIKHIGPCTTHLFLRNIDLPSFRGRPP